MNAVNLIPLERRRGGTMAAPGLPFLGLLAGLVIALVATCVYVGARDRVSSREARLAQVQTGVAHWSAAAARYSQDVTLAAERTRGIDNVRALVAARYDWSLLLGQLAKVTPAQVQLSSVTAATKTSAAAASTQPSGNTGTGSAVASQGIQLAGCASSQTSVADTMVALRRVVGIAQVSLLQSQLQNGGSGAGSCRFPVQFQLSIVFEPPLGVPATNHQAQATGAEAADKTSGASANGGAS